MGGGPVSSLLGVLSVMIVPADSPVGQWPDGSDPCLDRRHQHPEGPCPVSQRPHRQDSPGYVPVSALVCCFHWSFDAVATRCRSLWRHARFGVAGPVLEPALWLHPC